MTLISGSDGRLPLLVCNSVWICKNRESRVNVESKKVTVAIKDGVVQQLEDEMNDVTMKTGSLLENLCSRSCKKLS